MLRGYTRLRAIVLSAAAFAACAGLPWPDEPGVPVALSRAANVQAADVFLAKLTAERRAANRAAPVLAPRLDDVLRAAAEDLQAGKLTAGEVKRGIERWGSAWLVDCAGGENMKLPSALVERPSAVVSFAAAHFRPRSLASDQCAVLVVALEGSEQVGQEKI